MTGFVLVCLPPSSDLPAVGPTQPCADYSPAIPLRSKNKSGEWKMTDTVKGIGTQKPSRSLCWRCRRPAPRGNLRPFPGCLRPPAELSLSLSNNTWSNTEGSNLPPLPNLPSLKRTGAPPFLRLLVCSGQLLMLKADGT